jgi:SatD family (SatD)
MSKNTVAVLIADVVKSSAREELRGLLGAGIARASREHLKRKWIRLPYSITAGDEFQTISISPESTPEVILDLRVMLQPLQLRIGIGFGPPPKRIQPPVNRLAGQPFVFARAALESLKGKNDYKFEVLTSFRSKNPVFDSTANLIYGLHDTLLLRITSKQWENIGTFRKRRRLDTSAKALDVDASTVWRNLRRGHLWQLEETIAGMRTLIRTSHF